MEEQEADPLRPGQRRRHQLLHAEDLGDVHLRSRIVEHGDDPLPRHEDPLRAGGRHGEHGGAQRAALRTGGPRGTGVLGEPRRGQDPHGEQPHRDVRPRPGQRREPGQLLGEPEQRAPAVDPGGPRLLGPGRPGRPAAARRLAPADPDPEGPGQRRRCGLHRPDRVPGVHLRRRERAVRHDLLRRRHHPPRPGPRHRQLGPARRPGLRTGDLRPRDRGHAGAERPDRSGVHRAGHRADRADLEGVLGRHRRHRVRRLRRRHAAGRCGGRRHHVHRHAAGRRDRHLPRPGPGRGGQRVRRQRHRHPQGLLRRHPGTHGPVRPGVHRAGHRADQAHLAGVLGRQGRHRVRRLREQRAPRERGRGRHHLHRHPARGHHGQLRRAGHGRGGQHIRAQQHRDPQRLDGHRLQPRRVEADHRLVGGPHLRRGQRQRQLAHHLLGGGGRQLPQHPHREAGGRRRHPERRRQAEPRQQLGDAHPEHRGARA